MRGTRRAIFSMMLVLAVLAGAGCFRTEYVYGRGGDRDTRAHHQEWRHHFVVGLITSGDPIQVDAICPSGDATVYSYVGVLNFLLLLVPVLNLIWQTTSVAVYCGSGPAAGTTSLLELTPEQVGVFVRSPAFREAIRHDMPERLGELDRALVALEEPDVGDSTGAL